MIDFLRLQGPDGATGEGQLTIADEPREDQRPLHLMRDLEEPLDLDYERTNIHSVCLAHYDEIDPC